MISNKPAGILYIVATPIGNIEDISLRALRILKEVDAVICEEFKQGIRLLKKLKVDNTIICLNEHNEAESVQNILIDLMQGKSYALISDCGTPVFADPGQLLISTLTEMNIKVVPVPGPSSLMAALSVCSIPMDQFIFVGFLPPKSDKRLNALNRIKGQNLPLVVMDTPYRMTRLLEDVIQVFGKKKSVCLACDLTLPNELIMHGQVGDIYKRVSGQKKEFVLIIDNRKTQRRN